MSKKEVAYMEDRLLSNQLEHLKSFTKALIGWRKAKSSTAL